MRTADWEADQMEGMEVTDGTKTAMGNQLSGEDTVVTKTLGIEPNDTPTYAPGLELQHPIKSKLWVHGGQ